MTKHRISAALAALLLLPAAGCDDGATGTSASGGGTPSPTATSGPPSATSPATSPTTPPAASPTTPTPTPAPTSPADGTVTAAPVDEDHAVDPPGELDQPLLPADMLVYSQQPLDEDAVRRIAEVEGVEEVEQLSMAQVAVEGQVLNVAAVDPASYRRFTPVGSAQLTDIWTRVAGGELAILPGLGKRLQDEQGNLRLGNDTGAPTVHIGAYAPQVPRVDAVVNPTWTDDLGMREGNAVLVSTGMASPQSVREPIQRIVGDSASVQILGPDLDTTVQQTAFLTGGSVAAAVGTFSYRVLGGGRIQPDARWVEENIRTETVPILGEVTCHEVALPQFRAALTEIVTRGLADEIVPGEYAGCYYPRFIAGSTQPSLHSWGIAFDVNVPGNLRGTVGEIDREVVRIFKKWGFAWGGDWSYTDPMHFELAALVEPR